jgi:tetratricopeptide (TPR) repeat protein
MTSLLLQIMLIPERETPRDVKRLVLLQKFLDVLPDSELEMAANTFHNSLRYKAAAVVWKQAAQAFPDAYRFRFWQGLADGFSGQFDEAEEIANSFIQNPDRRMSEYDWANVYRIKGEALKGKGDIRQALAAFTTAAEKASDHDEFNWNFLMLFAAARMKDIQEFEQAQTFCDTHSGRQYRARPFYNDALRAYVLTANNRNDEAQALVQKWANNSNARTSVVNYFSGFNDGADIVENWKRLMDASVRQ